MPVRVPRPVSIDADRLPAELAIGGGLLAQSLLGLGSGKAGRQAQGQCLNRLGEARWAARPGGHDREHSARLSSNPRTRGRLVERAQGDAALMACAAIIGRRPTGRRDRAASVSLGRAQDSTIDGGFLAPGRVVSASTECLHGFYAAGGAITPPTAFQSVSEQSHDQGRTARVEPLCRSAYPDLCRSSRWILP